MTQYTGKKLHKYFEFGSFLFEIYNAREFFQFIGHFKQYELFFIHKNKFKPSMNFIRIFKYDMKRKVVKGIFLTSALVLLGTALTPVIVLMSKDMTNLSGLFFELWPLLPIGATAGVFVWLSYEYLNETEKTSL